MRRLTSKLFLPLCLLPFVAIAEDYSGWVQLTASDGSKPYSFNSAGKWSDGEPPSSTKNYYVPAGLLIKTSDGSATFGGGVIAVAGTVQAGNTGGTTMTWPELRLLPGGLYKHNSNNYIGGKIVVEGTAEQPARIDSFFWPDGSDKKFNYSCTFEGEPGSVLRIGHASLSGASYERISGTVVTITGGRLDGFKGKIIVGGETHLSINTGRIIPGGVHVESTGIFHSELRTGTITIGDLSLADGAELVNEFNACASVRWDVTNSLTLAGSPTLRLSFFDVGPDNTNGVTVIRLFGPAAANAPSAEAVAAMRVVARLGLTPLPRNVHVELVDNGDGTKDIRVVYDGIVTMRTHNSAYDVTTSAFTAGNESYWSTGVIPTEDFTGDVYSAWYRLTAVGWSLHLNYPGMEVHTRGGLYLHVLKATFKRLHIDGSGESVTFSTYSGPYTTEIDAPITLYPGEVTFSGRGGRGFIFTKEIDGHANVVCKPNMANSQPFSLSFQTANTNFTGSFTFTGYTNDYDVATGVDNMPRVTLNDGRNLGGVYEGENAWRALTFANYVYVTAAADLDFTEPTRGFYVAGGARLDVGVGKTVRIGAPFTFAGELVKLGAGRLVFGGPARFIDGAADTAPLAGTNVLTVSAGTLGVAATNALDGVALSFASGTALSVEPGTADADVLNYGAVCMKWATPFTVEGGGALPVTFATDYAPDGVRPRFDVAICTVSSTVAQSLSFAPQNGYRGYRLMIKSRANADGTVTFVACFTRRAMTVSFR